jgi:hypothetical protein
MPRINPRPKSKISFIRSHTELMRTIARRETQRNRLEIKSFVDEFEMQLRRWQARD